jgi:hypothetical protein
MIEEVEIAVIAGIKTVRKVGGDQDQDLHQERGERRIISIATKVIREAGVDPMIKETTEDMKGTGGDLTLINLLN